MPPAGVPAIRPAGPAGIGADAGEVGSSGAALDDGPAGGVLQLVAAALHLFLQPVRIGDLHPVAHCPRPSRRARRVGGIAGRSRHRRACRAPAASAPRPPSSPPRPRPLRSSAAGRRRGRCRHGRRSPRSSPPRHRRHGRIVVVVVVAAPAAAVVVLVGARPPRRRRDRYCRRRRDRRRHRRRGRPWRRHSPVSAAVVEIEAHRHRGEHRRERGLPVTP